MKKIQIFLVNHPWLFIIFISSAISAYVVIAGISNGFQQFDKLQALKGNVVKK